MEIELEKAVALHSSTLAWKIPWMEKPGELQSMGSLRIRHDWATSLSLFTFMHWRRKWQPTPVFLPGESQGWGSLVGCCPWGHTPLKWLSSSSSSSSRVDVQYYASYRCTTQWLTGVRKVIDLGLMGECVLFSDTVKNTQDPYCVKKIRCQYSLHPSKFRDSQSQRKAVEVYCHRFAG